MNDFGIGFEVQGFVGVKGEGRQCNYTLKTNFTFTLLWFLSWNYIRTNQKVKMFVKLL